MDGPVLDLVVVITGDVAASAAFYARLGVDLGAEPPPPWDTLHRSGEAETGAAIDLDDASFAPRWNEGWPAGRTGVSLTFKVATRDDVDRYHGELVAAGAPSMQAPYDAFWGARYAIVEDPSGNAVGIMSPSDEAYASAPPDPSA
jgi:catechol 2,3-dioxygenase-like lactoylglutathione lyase family enzyme